MVKSRIFSQPVEIRAGETVVIDVWLSTFGAPKRPLKKACCPLPDGRGSESLGLTDRFN